MNCILPKISAENTKKIGNDQIPVSEESVQKQSILDESSGPNLIQTQLSRCDDQIGSISAGLTSNGPLVVSMTSDESFIKKSITDESSTQIQKKNTNFADKQRNEESNEISTDFKNCDTASPLPEKHHVIKQVMTSSDLGCEGDNKPSLLCNMAPELTPKSTLGREPGV